MLLLQSEQSLTSSTLLLFCSPFAVSTYDAVIMSEEESAENVDPVKSLLRHASMSHKRPYPYDADSELLNHAYVIMQMLLA